MTIQYPALGIEPITTRPGPKVKLPVILESFPHAIWWNLDRLSG